MTTETEYEEAALTIEDQERDLIVRGLSNIADARTITIHAVQDCKAAQELLARMGYGPEGDPLV